MKSLKDCARSVLGVAEDNARLGRFAYAKYSEKYQTGPSIWYNGFQVISENEILVKYQYGGGDTEIDSSFIVSIENEGEGD